MKLIQGGFAFFLAAALLTSVATSVTARADSMERLIEVSSDAFPGEVFHISVGTDDSGDVTNVGYSEGVASPTVSTLDELRAGIVIYHNDSPSRDVVILKLDEAFTGKDGGKIILQYLFNGLRPHNYGIFNIDLVRGGTTWLPYAYDRSGSRSDRPFGHMKLVANHFLGKVIGISSVQTW